MKTLSDDGTMQLEVKDEKTGEPLFVTVVPMLLWCPACGERHIDEGPFANEPHHTHACQYCGVVWRPAIAKTHGMKFLPGYKNE